MRRRRLLATLAATALAACTGDSGEGRRLTLVSTHTLEDSGLLDSLAADFRAVHPQLRLRVVVAGSGEALALARRGDADLLLTHSPAAEAEFVRAGHGSDRRELMYNDFLVVGPPADPASVRGAPDAAAAFARIRATGMPFVSRGDDSGTHVMERRIWERAASTPDWAGYVESGLGMAEALRLAAQRGAYTLADRATWSVLRPQLALDVVQEGDPQLRNTYAVLRVRNAGNQEGAAILADWLRGPAAARRISGYHGGGLFFVTE